MADIGLHASPVIGKDTIVVGAAGREGTTPYRLDEVKGYVRAFDVRTGKRLWTFHTIPTKGEFGYDTWQNGHAEKIGHVGVWTQMAIDEELGMVYLPVETPTNDYYGGDAPATTCSPRAWWHSICGPASASGTSRSCITRCGTSTCRRRRSSPTSP